MDLYTNWIRGRWKYDGKQLKLIPQANDPVITKAVKLITAMAPDFAAGRLRKDVDIALRDLNDELRGLGVYEGANDSTGS